ncbi:MAG: DTW domain-containing protein [Planctomycetes bacterium]|nr:DTW domain-containing protein [Planctomycetota bacterium]
MPDPLPTHRERCYRCLRPAAACHCATMPTVPTRTRIEILQHPHERTHPFGTARLLRMCLPNAAVHVPTPGFTGTLEHRFELPPDAMVLWPHPDAPLLHELAPDRRPSTLVAIDGTWAHAKRLWRENAWLHALPHVRLEPAAPSRYRIRQEPRPDYVSTLEAVVEALRVLEPEGAGLDAMLAAFDGMIDRQIAHAASVQRFGRHKHPRQRPSRALAPQLFADRLAVTYSESILPGGDPAAKRQLVQWVAARCDGTTFEAIVRPEGEPPLAHHLQHMRLDPERVAAGEPLAAAVARFCDWLGPGAPITAWTTTTLDWGAAMVPPGTTRFPLKTNWCNLRNRRAGFLEEVLAAEGLTPVPLDLLGRARERLGNALAVARLLRSRPATDADPERQPVVSRRNPD